MSDYVKKQLWLIGAGYMAEEYAKVLKALDIDFLVIGRGETSAQQFTNKTGIDVLTGGVEKQIKKAGYIPEFAIVAVNVEVLAETTMKLIDYGVKNILVEKPAGLYYEEIAQLVEKNSEKISNIYVAYNRRFYASAKKAKEIIKEDGGVSSFHFEFTEWSHVIDKLAKPDCVKEQMFLANSSHVLDLAFYLGGKPKTMSCFKEGKLSWHNAGAQFVGAGKAVNGALFSYKADWEAPGRWGVEILTKKHRLVFQPLEKLKVQEQGRLSVDLIDIEDQVDIDFKPGIFHELKAFVFGENREELCTLEEQEENCQFYLKIREGKV